MNKTILIVEDEIRMRKLLSDYFRRENYNILEAGDGTTAVDIFLANNIDLIILDIMIPNMDGFAVCEKVRSSSSVPIILLTAKSEEEDKLLGFELGADEYVTKPFSPKVLVARVKTLLMRAEGTLGKPNSLENYSGLKINSLSREVFLEDKKINLSPKEYELLIYMSKNKNIALSRNSLLDNIWGYDYYGDLRTVDTHIKRLREKLKDKSDLIKTIRGSGYMFQVDEV